MPRPTTAPCAPLHLRLSALWCAAFFLSTGLSSQTLAAERARVLDAQPAYEQMGVPQQVCADETELVPPAPGTSADTPPIYTTTRRCKDELVYEQHITGWDVRFEHAGQSHTLRMAQKPGDWVEVPAHLLAPQSPAKSTQKIAQNQKQSQKQNTASKSKNTSKSTTKNKSTQSNTKNNSKSPSAAPRNQWSSDTAAHPDEAPRRPKSRSLGTAAPDAASIQRDIDNAAVIIAPPPAHIPDGVRIHQPTRPVPAAAALPTADGIHPVWVER